VSGYHGSCPSCGASIEFRLGVSLLRICEHCGVAVARKGADLTSYGRVAALLPTPSILKLGLEGRYAGAPRFTLVGRLQLDHGAGTWDEWMLGFENGSWAWLSEAQGQFHYMVEAPLPPLPSFDQLRVDETVDLGVAGVFVVTERHRARFMTAAGELPVGVEPGAVLNYADLSGPNGAFGTIDYGTGNTAEAVYTGRAVTPEELGLRVLDDEERSVRAQARSLSCPQCAGPIELTAPGETQRVACPYCGSMLDATGNFSVLEILSSPGFTPAIALGSRGRLRHTDWSVIGAMERSVTFEGIRYPWREYLLYEGKRGFRWLVESSGHWSFVEPVNAGDVKGRASPHYKGTRFEHFQTGLAVVDHVIGEFYWAVARGDAVESADYIAPPLMLSREEEQGKEEVTWSQGTYLEPDEVAAAFAGQVDLPRRIGVGPHQPSPWEGRIAGIWIGAVLTAAIMFMVYIAMLFASSGTVFRQSVTLASNLVPGAPESAVFTEPFTIPRSGNLQIRIDAPCNNSWLYVDGALINEETGGLDEFDVEVSYYHGADSDGSWSEGSNTSATYVPTVPPGRYVMRLAPQWQAGLSPGRYEVTVRSRVPRFTHLVLAYMVIFVWPAWATWRAFRFNVARWAESDHPHFEES
jgi:hypothetical protein